MRHHGATAVALERSTQTRTEHNGACKSDCATDGVNHRGSGKVMEVHAERFQKIPFASHRRQKSIRSPGPVTDDRINESRHEEAVDQIADESGTADHGTRRDRGARVRECKLEEPERQERNARRLIGGRRAIQEEPVQADETVAVAEHEGEAKGEEQNTAEAGVDDTFHQHVHRLTRPAEARFQHREAYLHAENEKRREQRPNRIERVDDVAGLGAGRGCRILCVRRQSKQAGIHEQCDRQNDRNAGALSDEQKRAVPAPLLVMQAALQAR